MNHRIRAALVLILTFTAVAGIRSARAEAQWPRTDLARRAQAWFAQMRGSEDEAREFFRTQISPAGLAEVSIDTRMERRRNTLDRTGGLTPVEVLSSTETELRVQTKAGNGDEPLAVFEADEAPPHFLLGVRLELGNGGGPGGPPRGPGLSDEDAVAAMRESLGQSAKSGAFSGGVLLSRSGKPLLKEAWGEADRGKHTLLTPETRFNIGSLGKIPTRIALAQLAQEGKVSLDDTLSKYLPDFPHAAEITLAILAEHRSGVGDFFNAQYDAMDRSKLRHNHDYLQLIRDQPLWFAPGTSERYSNGGYVLLGEVIAKVSGMDYYDYLAQHVYGPAGMTQTSALLEGDGTPGVAHGYTRKGAVAGSERDNVATRPWRGSAAGGSYSTLADLQSLDAALLGARLCNPAWSNWVISGQRPDRGSPLSGDAWRRGGFAFAGGAAGLNAEWQHEGDLSLIFFSNRDPEVTQPVFQPVRDVLRRMRSEGSSPATP